MNEGIELRKKALFWVGQSDIPATELFTLYEKMPSREMKEQLIFVYSQRDEKAAVDKLFDIAKTESDRGAQEEGDLLAGPVRRPARAGFPRRLLTASPTEDPAMRRSLATTPLLCLGFAATLSGQALTDRILAVREGTVRLSFGVREGICGDGETFIRDRSRGENNFISFDDGNSSWKGRGWRDRPCEPGPARIAITKSGGEVTRLRLYVGGDWRGGTGSITDLGMVPAPVAAKALVALAARS